MSETSLERRTYKVEEAAKLLGVGRTALYEAVKRGEVPCVQIGKLKVIPKHVVSRLLHEVEA